MIRRISRPAATSSRRRTASTRNASPASSAGAARSAAWSAAASAVDLYEPGHVRRTMLRTPRTCTFQVGEVHGRSRTASRNWPRCWPAVDTIARDRQSVGRALDQAVRQRHAQRRLGRDRPRRQCARWPRRDPQVVHPAGRAKSVRVGQALGFTLGTTARWSRETGAGVGGRSDGAGRGRGADAGRHQGPPRAATCSGRRWPRTWRRAGAPR